jgi:hypothetical protein
VPPQHSSDPCHILVRIWRIACTHNHTYTYNHIQTHLPPYGHYITLHSEYACVIVCIRCIFGYSHANAWICACKSYIAWIACTCIHTLRYVTLRYVALYCITLHYITLHTYMYIIYTYIAHRKYACNMYNIYINTLYNIIYMCVCAVRMLYHIMINTDKPV